MLSNLKEIPYTVKILFVMIRWSKLNFNNNYVQLLFALGALCMSLLLSDAFMAKMK